ncbi:hypothetical protein [Ahrensia sp. 13_GOM-1096m]|uniref:hypothetical protein n=1 Tax=Ahrensia sp. 13_GOM-1096m TaxID=1380380 RepID=UPI000479CD1D|nr:hypothetical protein [Ahrensia sp. 13_GOM-1096m]
MSYTSEDWRVAITNMIKKTSKGEITWEATDMVKSDPWREIDRSFKCELKDKIYVVSMTKKKNYFEEDEYYWQAGNEFSIFVHREFDFELLASAPEDLNVVWQLYSIAESNFAYTKNALGDLLD